MSDSALRAHVSNLLLGKGAHVGFDQVVADVPFEVQGVRPENAEHSLWEVLEHLRLAQWDILEFSRNPEHVSPAWPAGYWPDGPEPPNTSAWDKSVQAFRADLNAMIDLVNDPSSELFAPFPHGDGQTLLREALLVADHNAYHLGELVLLRRLLGAWE